MKVLFVDMHREKRSPSQRFRYEQYLDFLSEKGVQWEHSYLLNKEDDKYFYKPGNYAKKLAILLKSVNRREKDVRKANRDVDVVFVQREALMLGTTYFERQFAKSKARLIFDFDDSIWLWQESGYSAPNKSLSWLKNPLKTADIIRMSDHVVAGNQYLADYALQYNSNVTIIPTTIDTTVYKPKKRVDYRRDRICIGWSGSKTTIDHFEEALPVLREVKKAFGERIYFKVIGDGSYQVPELGIYGNDWRADTEIQDLMEIDIGIMPLPDNEWAKGKCGLKGLQYMALGIPTLMSPVGVNSDIINNGVNGFLPNTHKEWISSISELVKNEDLRKSIGESARQTVVAHYSMESQKEIFLNTLLG